VSKSRKQSLAKAFGTKNVAGLWR